MDRLSIKKWKEEYYHIFKEMGFCCNPPATFDKSWNWFNGFEEVKTAEEHRELITKLNCSLREWEDIYYPKYKSEGYRRVPARIFKETWKWFRGIPENKTAEEHRELISELDCTITEWIKEYHPRYKDQGYLHSPSKVYKKSWAWFIGNSERRSAEDHRELIMRLGCNIRGWERDHHPQYKDQGYVFTPTKVFQKPWRWFTGIDNFRLRTAEEHRELISELDCTITEWIKLCQEHYMDHGYYVTATKRFKKPWKWFKGEG